MLRVLLFLFLAQFVCITAKAIVIIPHFSPHFAPHEPSTPHEPSEPEHDEPNTPSPGTTPHPYPPGTTTYQAEQPATQGAPLSTEEKILLTSAVVLACIALLAVMFWPESSE